MTTLKKFCVGVAVAFLLCFAIPLRTSIVNVIKVEKDEDQFRNFLQRFSKEYPDTMEYRKRLTIFKNSLNQIKEMNSKRESNNSALYGLTKYSDLTQAEFLELMLTNKAEDRIKDRQNEIMKLRDAPLQRSRYGRALAKLPPKVDWRNRGVITDISNQKNCGACWAFAVVGVVEAMYGLKTNKTETLSVQQMIDCSTYGNHGCAGGTMCTLLHWLTQYNVNIEREEHYPLRLQSGKCKMGKNYTGVTVDRFICHSFVNNEDIILRLLAKHGPVAVSINALSWQNYLGGVIQFHCDGSVKMLNHAVDLVGYDLTHEIPHYIVKNSWGKEFGNEGYLYIAIGGNVCGLANEVAALTVA